MDALPCGADDEARTRYLHLGKVALYQMSYIRTKPAGKPVRPKGSPMIRYGADDEARTRYLHLGKVALYQMSYIRIGPIRGKENLRRAAKTIIRQIPPYVNNFFKKTLAISPPCPLVLKYGIICNRKLQTRGLPA